ncbi:MAG: hypothetical protein HYV95_13360 [Opitutae bacterium]|nr:hypothetical protein [Opitutae bacterium]
MKSLKLTPGVLGLLLLYVAALGGGGCWLVRTQRQAQRDIALLDRKMRERDQLMRLNPAPSQANEEAIAAELRVATQTLETLRAALQGREADALTGPPPARPLDIYFEYAGFVDRARVLAERMHVRLKGDERFGFASFTKESSAAALLPVVHRQRIVVQQMVETLLEAGPQELLFVQRERPLTVAQRSLRPALSPVENAHAAFVDGTDEIAADFFLPDERLTLRAPGLVNTSAFRVEFTGQTRVLRSFLNSLAEFRLPLVVRSVEVEPLGTPAGSLTRDPAPLVSAASSKFSVVVECLEILPAASGTPL